MDEKIFFVCGMPKAGTTLVQMLLDRHPEVSCPPEHEFRYLLNSIRYSVNSYNQVLVNKDNITGRQGARLLTDDDVNQIFKAAVLTALRSAGTGKRVLGAKDNEMRTELPYYNELFDNPKFVLVFRDPRDIAVSSYHHNQRVEPFFMARARSLDSWCLQVAHWWREHIRFVRAFMTGKKNVYTIRYKHLTESKAQYCRELFSFLEIDCQEKLIDRIVAETEFERTRQVSGNNPFFRRGQYGSWKDEISADTNFQMQEICRDELKELGYELVKREKLAATPT